MTELTDSQYEGDWPTLEASDAPIHRAFGGAVDGGDESSRITALLGGQVCGMSTKAPSLGFAFVVASDEFRAGCGKTDEPITFCLDRKLLEPYYPVKWTASFTYLISLHLLSPATDCPRTIYPDTNCDHKLTLLDVLTSLRELSAAPPANCPPAGDTRCDGSLDAADVLSELAWLSELDPHLPASCDSFSGFAIAS